MYDHKNHYFPFFFYKLLKDGGGWICFGRRVISGSTFLFLGKGGGGLVQSPGSRVLSPGFTTAFRMCRPNCDRKKLKSCLLGCQKGATKLPKIQKVDKLLPKVLHIFIQYIVKQWIVFFVRSNWLLNPWISSALHWFTSSSSERATPTTRKLRAKWPPGLML